ncbi:DUF2029 domain-containing protein [Corynebacterium sp. zg-331]|uniref:glycosyltransferase 87 family protein n=1 Tax=unclassified Corynebacterium TaxID=2624378 RepID=UPI0016425CC0|nr:MULTISPECIES: glycosyltransferase 87 family protein [unclassified Corynebacterium]MBC3185662.1 DUF2029 domain-containing protein [Corynebacterium sp. zg-331]
MSSPTDSPRTLSPAILAVATAMGLANALLWFTQADGGRLDAIWAAGEHVRSGNTFLLYRSSAYPDQPFFYPPLLAALAAPITAALPLTAAQFLLALGQGLCLVVFLACAYTLWFRRTMPLTWLIPAALAVWFSEAFQSSSADGHLTVFALAAATWALTAAHRRPVVSGLLLGGACCLAGPPLVLIVPLLLWAGTRLAGAWAIVGAGATVVLSALCTGLFSVREWVAALREVLGGAVLHEESQAFSALVLAPRHPLPRGIHTRVLTEAPLWVHLIVLLAVLLLAAATCWVAWLNTRYAQQILLVGWLCTAFLASPLLWTHSLLVLVLPIAGILAMVRTRRYQDALWTPLAIAVLLLFWPLASTTRLADGGMGFPWGGLLAATVITVLFLLAAVAPTQEPGRALREAAARREIAADVRERYRRGSQYVREAWECRGTRAEPTDDDAASASRE